LAPVDGCGLITRLGGTAAVLGPSTLCRAVGLLKAPELFKTNIVQNQPLEA